MVCTKPRSKIYGLFLKKKRLAVYERAPKNREEIWLRVQTEWAEIPNRTIDTLLESMPKRVKSVCVCLISINYFFFYFIIIKYFFIIFFTSAKLVECSDVKYYNNRIVSFNL